MIVYDSLDYSELHRFKANNSIKDAKFIKEDKVLVID
jgi:hypothetical protein